ncbi:NOT2/NOT3/NOT5 domain-containing protein [Histomonas meleagridis]|uniref:NOT2/NOT3/NOT5 domain-containing protein n=1 Tax=Histomonas meleagridis TaxID=135588 RepID=UPI00355A7C56|nr:NOT2/NOT3/NOT5 domain-containing protein [Histomonas meleagridis]KAH0797165.1 NOT2/NOT3/NOT5 domain-containing protein [Histomonas meleagridis]
MAINPQAASQFQRQVFTPNSSRPIGLTVSTNRVPHQLTIQKNVKTNSITVQPARSEKKTLNLQLNTPNGPEVIRTAPTITLPPPRAVTPQNIAPSPEKFLQVTPPQVQPKPQQIRQPPQSPVYHQVSLNSFVMSFDYGKTFNETDLSTLGLDLKCQEPLLPMLHSVLSDAPLLDHSCYPIPECYAKVSPAGKPEEKISLFSDQTLLFIFYTHPNSELQEKAANKLIKKGYKYSPENEEWTTPDGYQWNLEQWKEVEETQTNNES